MIPNLLENAKLRFPLFRKNAEMGPRSMLTNMEYITVIVPTRNRQTLLYDLLKNLEEQTQKVKEVIIVDSSDTPVIINARDYSFTLTVVHTTIKSAATQRNIGIDNLQKETQFVAFLDDDVRVEAGYLETLIKTLKESDAIGVSGVTSDLIGMQSNKYRKIIKSIFLLDSFTEGCITKGGINIPVRKIQGIYEVDWLIGCAIWKIEIVQNLRFENDFLNQSVGEDVLFSHKASKIGRLVVDASVVIKHLYSELNRPSNLQYWKMWSQNRKRILKEINQSQSRLIFYYWCNLGQVLMHLFNFRNKSINRIESIVGITIGSWK